MPFPVGCYFPLVGCHSIPCGMLLTLGGMLPWYTVDTGVWSSGPDGNPWAWPLQAQSETASGGEGGSDGCVKGVVVMEAGRGVPGVRESGQTELRGSTE